MSDWYLDPEDAEAARAAIAPLRAQLKIDERNAEFEAHRYRPEDAALPSLHLEDVSAIPFLDGISGVEEYQHRARVRCGTGDLFAAATAPAIGYEAYSSAQLGLGSPTMIPVEPAKGREANVAEACSTGAAFAALCEATTAAGGLVIHPYMGIEAVWALAAKLHEATGCRVAVLAPPPPVTWLANDKGHLTDAVARCAGVDAVPETHEVRGLEALITRVADLGTRYARVGVKRTRCASAMGNLVLSANACCDAQGEPAPTLRETLQGFLKRTRWDGDESLLATQWVETTLSPSSQLWIPPLGDGEPRLDGLYEQLLTGEHGMFVGSRPSTLPSWVHEEMAGISLLTAAGLQACGYVGRCSFDFVIEGDVSDEEGFAAIVTECNGRWGGTSTPMALVDRLTAGHRESRPDYIAKDVISPALVGRTVPELVALLGEHAFDAKTGRGTFALYNTGPLHTHGKIDVAALGDSPEAAAHAMNTLLPQLWSLT
ncbi:MAG: hypothetical protein ACI81R_001392 [Bradymonadia bacterium]|jgi:hypothetical protein